MKHLFLFGCGAVMLALSSCKEPDPFITTKNVSGSEAVISWQGCAFFTDHDIKICFIDANEYRCRCNEDCFGEGAIDAQLLISTSSGPDTIITLTTNSNPINLPSVDTIGGKIIRFVNTTTDVSYDCIKDYRNYEKYKVIVVVE